jgi:type II secretory ATPase GspE/PulE/Tfp pilus assembly ATPase PilB-like protein
MQTALYTLAAIEAAQPFSYVKLSVVAALVVAWGFACQWADIDATYVKTKREQWNLIVLGGGIAGFLVLFSVPWPGVLFYLGLAFFLLLAGGGLMAYVVHRNGRVVRSARILTPTHLKGLLTRGKGEKKEKLDRGIRVILHDAEGKSVRRPEETEAIEAFDEVQDFLFDAFWRRATEVDLALGSESTRVIYRIDGVASEKPDGLSSETGEQIVTYLKTLAGLNPEERRRPQVGHIQAGLLAESGNVPRLEVATSGSTAGERMRLTVQSPAQLKRIEELGFTEARAQALRELIKAQTGLVIFSGPRKSGVTTTQYAVLREHDAFMQNLHTIEKAPLLDLDNVTQHRYRNDPDISYARQVQTVIRREPDVLVIGECEDREVAQLACQAAGDDKKIYLAIEAASSVDALARYLALVEDPPAVAKALLGVVNQRLVRILCTTCRQAYRPDEKLLRKANLPVDKIDMFYRQPAEPIVDKRGREIICQTCRGTGYLGRTGVFELMVVDKATRALVAQGAPMKAIKAQARKARMHYLQEEGLLKVMDGTTSLNEVLRSLRVDK